MEENQTETIETIEPIRKYNCLYYDKCLDYHAWRDFPEINCYKCQQWEPDILWRHDDPFAIAKFLVELFKEGGEVEEDD